MTEAAESGNPEEAAQKHLPDVSPDAVATVVQGIVDRSNHVMHNIGVNAEILAAVLDPKEQSEARRAAMVGDDQKLDWIEQFGAIAQAAKHLKARQAILDGEAVVLASSGVADFHALRRELGKRNSDRLVYQAFDLLYLDGYDVRSAPYVERKAALKALLVDAPAALSYVDYLEGDGQTIYEHACAMREYDATTPAQRLVSLIPSLLHRRCA